MGKSGNKRSHVCENDSCSDEVSCVGSGSRTGSEGDEVSTHKDDGMKNSSDSMDDGGGVTTLGLGSDIDDSSGNRDPEHEVWINNVLIKNGGHLAFLIHLLPLKLIDSIRTVVDVAVCSEASDLAVSPLRRGLIRTAKRRRLAIDIQKRLAKHVRDLFTRLKRSYLHQIHRNLDVLEQYALRPQNIFGLKDHVARSAIRDKIAAEKLAADAPYREYYQPCVSVVGRKEDEEIDAQLDELRRKLVMARLDLEKNRRSMTEVNQVLKAREQREHYKIASPPAKRFATGNNKTGITPSTETPKQGESKVVRIISPSPSIDIEGLKVGKTSMQTP